MRMPKRPNRDLRCYWEIFRDARFTSADLWRWFRGAYYQAGGQDSWPREDFLQWLALCDKSWIEDALGPRGGQGWRIAPDAVQVCLAEEAYIQQTQDEASALIESVTLRLGELRLEQTLPVPRVWEVIWQFEPPVPLDGPNVDEASRLSSTAPFSFRFPSTASLEDLQTKLDSAEVHISHLAASAIERHSHCIKQLERVVHPEC